MIDILFRSLAQGLGWGAGGTAGAQLTARFLEPNSSVPSWTGTVRDTLLTVMLNRGQGRAPTFTLIGTADGQSDTLAHYPDYPALLGGVQQWEIFLNNGGTIASWTAHQTPAVINVDYPRELR